MLSELMKVARGDYTQKEWAEMLPGGHSQAVWRWENVGVDRRHYRYVLEVAKLRPDLARELLAAIVDVERSQLDPMLDRGLEDVEFQLLMKATGLDDGYVDEWLGLC
jgi:hypothetical protein